MPTETLAVAGLSFPNAWRLGAGASKVAAVRGPDDDDDSYIASGTVTNRVQRFTLAAPRAIHPADTLADVVLRGRCMRGGGQDATFTMALILDGVPVTGATQTATATYATATETFATRPGGGRWTLRDLQALDVQIQNAQARDVRCSTLEALVTYRVATAYRLTGPHQPRGRAIDMATLAELHGLYVKGDTPRQELFNKIVAAVMKAAEGIRVEATSVTNHINRAIWAKQAFQDPPGKAEEMWGAILAANAGATLTAILTATDAAIETAVSNAVDLFADGSS